MCLAAKPRQARAPVPIDSRRAGTPACPSWNIAEAGSKAGKDAFCAPVIAACRARRAVEKPPCYRGARGVGRVVSLTVGGAQDGQAEAKRSELVMSSRVGDASGGVESSNEPGVGAACPSNPRSPVIASGGRPEGASNPAMNSEWARPAEAPLPTVSARRRNAAPWRSPSLAGDCFGRCASSQ